ncbi:hypothetical protein [Actinoplanes regularis]|uniref:hypothetical protein n=1 Tax=Actinoplanes regularis TaxID=52697 RepID=UPI002557B792|nr:hypothetical protein [Actinoplanes regularis]
MTSDFTVELRGYDRQQVERLLAEADAALASSDPALREQAQRRLLKPDFIQVLRGYSCGEVNDAIRDRLLSLRSTTDSHAPVGDPAPSFVVVLRGYDTAQVDEAFARLEVALGSDDAFARASVRDALRAADFKVRLRGYERTQVDVAVREAVRWLS